MVTVINVEKGTAVGFTRSYFGPNAWMLSTVIFVMAVSKK